MWATKSVQISIFNVTRTFQLPVFIFFQSDISTFPVSRPIQKMQRPTQTTVKPFLWDLRWICGWERRQDINLQKESRLTFGLLSMYGSPLPEGEGIPEVEPLAKRAMLLLEVASWAQPDQKRAWLRRSTAADWERAPARYNWEMDLGPWTHAGVQIASPLVKKYHAVPSNSHHCTTCMRVPTSPGCNDILLTMNSLDWVKIWHYCVYLL